MSGALAGKPLGNAQQICQRRIEVVRDLVAEGKLLAMDTDDQNRLRARAILQTMEDAWHAVP
ncbi:hypothetical protein [Candidatus Thiosymbion oneisti]|uniref:hypothetical protein n=1 Tax=Candidatus Thiosymbion oneisti TaxID=589554 RepID=UPI00105FAFF1|nr:hypothetical protein [Candidatus Thiosymbion oneisti]